MNRPLSPEQQQRLASLPKVDRLVADPALVRWRHALGEAWLAELAREEVERARRAVLERGEAPREASIRDAIDLAASRWQQRRARRVINATGVVLHTNLGRAPLPADVCAAVAASAAGYTSIELDLASGKRGHRGVYAERVLAQLTGAEAALVVNNCAAAVMLVLSAITRPRGVVVSRGELIEIGGGFRIPDVLERSGSRLVEVGCTNKTHLRDYAAALDTHPEVAAILKVHRSNFRQEGFVAQPSRRDLAGLARARGIVLIEDLGGGALVDLNPHGLDEPTVAEAVAEGADIVCFSTDKALGGPQGGAIVGRREHLDRIRRDPLARALRLGRLPLVALEGVLAHYLAGTLDRVPTVATIRRPVADVRARVEAWRDALDRNAEVVEVGATAGGGTAAEETLPSYALSLGGHVEAMARTLRQGEPPVMARIRDDRLLLDGRTVMPDEDEALVRRLREL